MLLSRAPTAARALPRTSSSRLARTPAASPAAARPVPTRRRPTLPFSASQSTTSPTQMRAIPPTRTPDDLLVIGPGVLGGLVAARWAAAHPAAAVIGQTNSTAAHGRLASLNIVPRVNADAERTDGAPGRGPWPHVLFAAPPSGSPDYVASIKAALALWNADARGAFVYTGSAAVFGEDAGGDCGDASPLVPRGAAPRTDVLLTAEETVLQAGGCVLRLAGLYHKQRGAHTFFLRQGTVDRWGGYTVNLLHYEDAAALATAVLSGAGSPADAARGWRGRAFIGADGAPITFQDMCDAAVEAVIYEGAQRVNFTGAAAAPSTGRGKRLDASGTRAALAWAPKYSSFADFVKAGGKDAYTEDARLGAAGAPHK